MDSDPLPTTSPVDPAPPLRVLVAVCTYNEIENLPELTERITASLPQADMLVVDDDSPDGSGHWALDQATRDPRIRVIIREKQRGLGTAIRQAFLFAIEQQYDYLLNLDGDLSHHPETMPELLAVATGDPQFDVVVGSRYCPGGSIRGWPWRRRVMSRTVNRFAVSVLRLPISDCSGSYRCYRVAKLAEIAPATLESEGYSILEEVLVRLRSVGATMAEVPIEFTDRQRGSSKLTFAEAIRSAKQLLSLIKFPSNSTRDQA